MERFARYLDTLAAINELNHSADIQWFFHCGMLFLSKEKWWDDFKYRASVHEGIDITYFKKGTSDIEELNTTTRVPAFENGTILNICNDFLGQTIVAEYKSDPAGVLRVIHVYAHVNPLPGLKAGDPVRKDRVIAHLCDNSKNPNLPVHLHFSCFEVSTDIPFEQLNWDLFSKQMDINMIYPVFL